MPRDPIITTRCCPTSKKSSLPPSGGVSPSAPSDPAGAAAAPAGGPGRRCPGPPAAAPAVGLGPGPGAPAEDIEARVNEEVKRMAPQVRMPGFRPGKVPPNLIRKMHGDALRGDALNGAVQDGVQKLLAEQNIRPALQPQVELDEKYEPGKDAEVRVRVEALPDVPAPQIEGLKLERLTVDADEAAVDEQVKQLATQSKRWEDAPKKR